MNFRKEHVIYTLMWIVMYLSPVMGLYMRMSNDPYIDFSWNEIFNAWKFNTVWLALFAIHNFLLAPILIIKRRTWLYTALCAALLGTAMLVLLAMRPSPDERKCRQWRHRHEKAEMQEHGDRRHQPGGEQHRHDFDMMQHRHDGGKPHRRPWMRPNDPMPMPGPGEMIAALGGLLLMGMNIGVKLYFKSQEDSKLLSQIERHNLERQLEYLRYQVNPHFFMNTLNNIHALVDIDPERAKTTIVELSKMMRYILYEGNNRLIPLPREAQFLRNYVQLMRLRYTDRVSIDLHVPDTLPDLLMPPLLLIIFVENAFKHGISYINGSFVEISLSVHGDRLLFGCRNSKPQRPAGEERKGGMGLINVRRRLELLFADNYTLDIEDAGNEYRVRLDIPLAATAQ